METIVQILMRRDNMTREEAQALIEEAREDLQERIAGNGEDPHEICADWFDLEPDYIMELI